MAAVNSQVSVLNCVSTPTNAYFQRPLAPARISFKSSKFSTNALTSSSIGFGYHHVHGGGALGAQMNLFGRFARIIKSYANAFISMFEDPERILEQAVLEMNGDLVRMRQATVPVLASQKQLENKYKSVQRASEDWYKRAQLALSRGDENLAREALKQRKYYSDNASSLSVHLAQQQVIIDSIVTNTRVLESKIQEAKSKRHTLKARAQSAKTATKLTEMLHNVKPNSALSAFEKMEDKVVSMESRADALNQLVTDDLEGKFAVLENFSADDDLAILKREMCANLSKGELPPGRTTIASSGSTSFLNLEMENELNELRTKLQ